MRDKIRCIRKILVFRYLLSIWSIIFLSISSHGCYCLLNSGRMVGRSNQCVGIGSSWATLESGEQQEVPKIFYHYGVNDRCNIGVSSYFIFPFPNLTIGVVEEEPSTPGVSLNIGSDLAVVARKSFGSFIPYCGYKGSPNTNGPFLGIECLFADKISLIGEVYYGRVFDYHIDLSGNGQSEEISKDRHFAYGAGISFNLSSLTGIE